LSPEFVKKYLPPETVSALLEGKIVLLPEHARALFNGDPVAKEIEKKPTREEQIAKIKEKLTSLENCEVERLQIEAEIQKLEAPFAHEIKEAERAVERAKEDLEVILSEVRSIATDEYDELAVIKKDEENLEGELKKLIYKMPPEDLTKGGLAFHSDHYEIKVNKASAYENSRIDELLKEFPGLESLTHDGKPVIVVKKEIQLPVLKALIAEGALDAEKINKHRVLALKRSPGVYIRKKGD
jgi:hypothetical protein